MSEGPCQSKRSCFLHPGHASGAHRPNGAGAAGAGDVTADFDPDAPRRWRRVAIAAGRRGDDRARARRWGGRRRWCRRWLEEWQDRALTIAHDRIRRHQRPVYGVIAIGRFQRQNKVCSQPAINLIDGTISRVDGPAGAQFSWAPTLPAHAPGSRASRLACQRIDPEQGHHAKRCQQWRATASAPGAGATQPHSLTKGVKAPRLTYPGNPAWTCLWRYPQRRLRDSRLMRRG